VITAGAVPELREMPGTVPARCPQSGSGPDANADVLAAWARSTVRRDGQSPGGGLKFAFYGRVSTEDWQDPVTSRARQREQAAVLVAGHG
jgi:site-specific DNA recombinase